ncbi:hypothetical protein ZWY2020_030152 [Hordeum vulgare]|nr:hypothetical protein ZWY2020_030152 [Hordeum vulgare]
MAATVGELDRFEDLSVSSGTKKGPSFWEEAAPKPTRRGGDKGSAKAEVPKPSRRGRRKAAGEQEKEAYQQEIRDEFEEKGYVEIPDNFEEDNKRINLEAYRIAYLKVFGTEPPAKI